VQVPVGPATVTDDNIIFSKTTSYSEPDLDGALCN
jgi:hypothetical protein